MGFDERTEIRTHGHPVSRLTLTTALKKAFVCSTVSRPNNSARRTPRSRVILYPMALQGAGEDSVSVPVTSISVDDPAVQQHVEAAEKIVDVLDGSVFTGRNPHELHEPGRAIALEERAARAALVHQLVRVLVGILDHVVIVAVVDHLHHRARLPGKARGGHLTRGLQRRSPGTRSRSSELRPSGRRAGA